MKTIYISLLLGLLLISCNDEFMDRFPKTDITDKVFFNTIRDLEVYTNGFYDELSAEYRDVYSDNIAFYADGSITQDQLKGLVSSTTITSWKKNWEFIRSINYFLINYQKVEGDAQEINHFVGIARFFRALKYYELVKKYSNVTWYNTPLSESDEELLYKKQDSRKIVVDSIMADLRFATKNIKAGDSKTRITKMAAFGYMARIALHEGTFRKYHSELNFNDGDDFITIAKNAARTIIDEGGYSLNQGNTAYRDLFISYDLNDNEEIILFSDYDNSLERFHNILTLFDYQYAMSRDFINDYLYIDPVTNEAIPFHEVAGNETMVKVDEFKNRDPRLIQTVAPPRYIKPGTHNEYRFSLTHGGYPQIKYYTNVASELTYGSSFNDLPLIRYSEILLIYAEALAELRELNQEGLDITINEIRGRSMVPKLIMDVANNNSDPSLAEKYPNVGGDNKGVLLEIRRERRIELACEGFRYDDLMRWKCGERLAVQHTGMYIPHLNELDITGDGVNDVAIFLTPEDNNLTDEYRKEKNLDLIIIENSGFYLSEGDHGFILNKTEKDGKGTFHSPKDYYLPISQDDITINPNLDQTPFWDK